MSNYYFLAAALPPLTFGRDPDISWQELVELLENHLDASHWHQLGQVRRMIDLDNFIMHWKGQSLSPYGFWSLGALQDHLAVHERAEKPISVWLDKFSSDKDRISLLENLRVDLMLHMRKKPNIVGKFYALVWQMEGALLSARLQLLNEENDPKLVERFRQDRATSALFDSISSASIWQEPLFARLLPILHLESPLEQQKEMSGWRIWAWNEYLQDSSLFGKEHFSFARVVAYVLEMIEIDRFQNLDLEKGIEALPQATKKWLEGQQ